MESDNSEELSELFSELLLQKDLIIESQDVHLQTLFVRCFRKTNLYQASHSSSESLSSVFALLEMTY